MSTRPPDDLRPIRAVIVSLAICLPIEIALTLFVAWLVFR